MSILQSSLRFTLLENRAAIRSLGWVPWLVAVGWLMVATLQEPLLLRQHGIRVSQQAAFVVWVVLLLQQLLARDPRAPRSSQGVRQLSSGVLLLGMATGYAISAWLVDCFRMQSLDSGGIIRQGSVFVVAWLPIAAATTARPQGFVHKMLWGMLLGLSVVLSEHLSRLGFTPGGCAAALLGALAAFLLSPGSPPRH